MKKKFLILYILFLFYIICFAGDTQKPDQSCDHVRNIILLIGDGMGTSQIYAGLTANKGSLNIERATFVGFSKTYSEDSYNTDSGAGGTAISSGYKTNNHSIGVDKDGKPHETILESAEKKGLSTGLVVTSSVTHATPASFVAHINSRFSEETIAESYLGSGIDIIIGGGRKFFEKRTDSLNLFNSLRSEGYLIVGNLLDIDTTSDKNIGCFAADNSLPSFNKGRGNFLPDASKIALNKLNRSDKGFFLLIEGSQIDWGGHDNIVGYVTSEVIDFDRTVGIAFDFADKNPGTLVIVTADHETGGLAIINGNFSDGTIDAKFSSIYHTGVMVPVFTYGSGASAFAGIYENTEIYYKMICLLGLNE